MLISTAEKGGLGGADQKETLELGWLCVLILRKRTAFPFYNTVGRERSCLCCCDTVGDDVSALLQTNPLPKRWCPSHCSMLMRLMVGMEKVLLSIQAER